MAFSVPIYTVRYTQQNYVKVSSSSKSDNKYGKYRYVKYGFHSADLGFLTLADENDTLS
jgi:hypothetical protein